MKRFKQFWVGDFETLPEEFTHTPAYQQRKDLIYAWRLVSDDNKYRWTGIDTKSFLSRLVNLPWKYEDVESTEFYFHNGSGFDFKFILAGLKQNGYQQREFKDCKKVLDILRTSPYKEQHTAHLTKREPWKPYLYEVLVNKQKQIFQIQVSIPGVKELKNGRIKPRFIFFKCSYLMFNRSLSFLGDILLKMGLITHNKQKVKFKTTPYQDHKEMVDDKMTWDYLLQDVEILRVWWNNFSERLSRTQQGLTAGATAVNSFLSLGFNQIKNKYCQKFIPFWTEIKQNDNFISYYTKKGSQSQLISRTKLAKQMLDIVFPISKLGQYPDLRNWYNGGLVHNHAAKMGIPQDNVNGYDINSAYPSVMLTQDLPCGEPLVGDVEGAPYKLYAITALSNLHNPHNLNFIIKKSVDDVNFYNNNIPAGHTFYLQTPEYKQFIKSYQGDYKTEIKYSFKTVPGREIFGDFINHWYQIKEENKDPILTLIAKLMMNSLYGKFGTKTIRDSKIFNPEADFKITGTMWENETTLNDYEYYLPVGMAITSYVRMMLVKAVGNHYDKFIYCDTDSIWMNDYQLPPELVGKQLGQWKLEAENSRGLFTKKKRYIITKNDEVIKVSLASYKMPDHLKSFKTFTDGVKEMDCGLKNQEVEYGVVLTPQVKDLEPVWHEKFSRSVDVPWHNKETYWEYRRSCHGET